MEILAKMSITHMTHIVTFLLPLIFSTTGQEISDITVNETHILPEEGKLYDISITFNVSSGDDLKCILNCNGKLITEMKPTPRHDLLSKCMYTAEFSSAQKCKWTVFSFFGGFNYTADSDTVTISNPIAVDRSPLLAIEGSQVTLSTVLDTYEDPLVCSYDKNGWKKCNMIINDIGSEDAGIHNITICPSKSDDGGCIHALKEVIVYKCTYNKNFQVLAINITDTNGRVKLSCTDGCSNVAPDDRVNGSASTVLTWQNVTGSPIIQGIYNGSIVLETNCTTPGKEEMDPPSKMSTGEIVGIVIGIVTAFVVAFLVVCYRKKTHTFLRELLPCTSKDKHGGDKKDNSSKEEDQDKSGIALLPKDQNGTSHGLET